MLLSSVLLASMLQNPLCDVCWLRDDSRKNATVLTYLKNENKTSEHYLKPLMGTQEKLLNEWEAMAGNKAEKPWFDINGYHYKTFNKGVRGVVVRKNQQREDVVINMNQRAENHAYYRLGNWSVSPNNRLVAIAENTVGDDNYSISIIDIASGEIVTQFLGEYADTLVWKSDNEVIVVENEANTYRPYKVVLQNIKTNTSVMLYQETNPAWLVSAYTASDAKSILIQSNNHNTSVQYLLRSEEKPGIDPKTALRLVKPRKNGVEYYVDVLDGKYYIKSNQGGKFAIYTAQDVQREWTPIIEPKGDLTRWYLASRRIVIEEKKQGITLLEGFDLQGQKVFSNNQSKAASVGWMARNTNPASQTINVRTMGLSQPPAWTKLDIETGETVSSEADVYNQFDTNNYVSELISVKHQGVEVPVSLVYRKDMLTDDSPVFLYGYGAYGVTMRPYFMPQIISLVDRGAVYAIAHVRGGGFKGDDWYQAGKGVNRLNSIQDFTAVAQVMKQFRIESSSAKVVDRDILALGSSAGGTLVAAAINQHPELFKGAALQVPFVDVLSSMSDESIPLTRQQYAEWGNPNKPEERNVMRAYSPFDNISAQDYPAMLVRSGLFDSRVPYWEAAKYTARIKALSTANNPYLLVTDLQSGHSTDRTKALRQQAMDYAFLLNLTNLNK
ncbi:prolyl oligopeptidase family serine peptidase [Photobacterium profundum]|uniref:prolyl oligopeptidase family serine peptidase n=1 Tax=Photobacterium profundum TaxID=74109 RepID=UPI003D14FCE9